MWKFWKKIPDSERRQPRETLKGARPMLKGDDQTPKVLPPMPRIPPLPPIPPKPR